MKEPLKLTKIIERFRESNYEWERMYYHDGVIYLLKGSNGEIFMDIVDSSGEIINLEF